MPRSRDPFPFPRHENDQTFTGKQVCQKPPFKNPTHLAQNAQPWSRLNDTATETSLRRSVLHRDEETPRDSLDFHLRSVYDNHLDFLRDKSQTLQQRETLMDRRAAHPEADEAARETRETRVWVNPQKESIYSIEGTIESHHNASTNRGYSRKHDGGFYSA
ncbi:protein C1orf194 homolog [Pygocentrus nattereri]|uniref:Uncharacterized protein n=1 Tax=Pygocentrus nattereri TaxID=42514 RepID=A0AAR2ISM3_PYGNA|nr:protein C1orf194 homolog [Pygocentrus nattereri]